MKTRIGVKNYQIQEVGDDEVDYELASTSRQVGSHANMVPLSSAVNGPRIFYGARFFDQAVSSANREAPLVQALDPEDPDGRSFDEIYGGRAGAIRADQDMEVLEVDPDGIKVRDAAGDRIIELYNNLPFNRKSALHNTAKVKPGDRLTKGQLMAVSNFTDDNGTLALGANMRTALVPYKGFTMDDAIALSESAANKLSSIQSYTLAQKYDANVKGGKSHYTAIFPETFKRTQLENLDDDGIAKIGTVLQPGDPIMLATSPRVASSKDLGIGSLSKNFKALRQDASQTWDGQDPARIVDVARAKDGTAKVLLEFTSPMRVGDKGVYRAGQKFTVSHIIPDQHMPRTLDGQPLEMMLNPAGIPSRCFDEETELLTDAGWLRGADVTMAHKVATLNPQSFAMEFQAPLDVVHLPFDGKLYKLENQQLDMLVTPNHRQFSAPRKRPEAAVKKMGCRISTKIYGKLDPTDPAIPGLFEFAEAQHIFGQARKYLKACTWVGNDPEFFHVPAGTDSKTNHCLPGYAVTSKNWAAFMGWYLAEGYAYIKPGKKGVSYVVAICQSTAANPTKCAEIAALLDDMGVSYYRTKTEFVISHKGLFELLKPLGGAQEKFIPRSLLDLPPPLLAVMLDALMKGDGNTFTNEATGHRDTRSFTTGSRRLADGVQEIAAKLGISVNIKREKRRGDHACYYMSLKKLSPAAWVNFCARGKSKQVEGWVPYKGHVHCVTVPNGIVFARRNGKAVFSGNSNNSTLFELMLGKVARKLGTPIKVPTYTNPGERWIDIARAKLKEAGLTPEEEIFDPIANKKLARPVMVGDGFVMRLHHTSESKADTRGQAAYDCHDDQTEVLTETGWKFWEDVTLATRLAVPDMVTGVLTYEEPTRLVRYNFDGEMLAYKSRKLDLCVTPNHKFLAAPRTGKKGKRPPARELTADDLRTKEGWKVPVAGFRVPTTNRPPIKVPGIPDTHWRTDIEISSVDFYALLGWFLAEGSVEADDRFVIWQSEKANPTKFAEIRALLRRISGTEPWSFYGRGLRCNDKRLGIFMRQFGSQCFNKRVTARFINTSAAEFDAFLHAYCAGDGSESRRNRAGSSKINRTMHLASSSIGLIDDVQKMLFDHGRASTIALIAEAGSSVTIRGRTYVRQVDTYALQVFLSTQEVEMVGAKKAATDARYKGGWRRVRYTGPVYCATTRTGWLVTRRNGKILVAGNSNEQPQRGGREGGGAKRLSGLEVQTMLSAGAYENLREGATLRGQRNDDFWRQIRAGQQPRPPGKPFVWDKFRAMLTGAGYATTQHSGGSKFRIGPFTDKLLDQAGPLEISKGDMVHLNTLEPIKGGLFDPALTSTGKYGSIRLPEPVPNPAMAGSIRALLGITEKDFREILAGRKNIDGSPVSTTPI